VKPCPICRSGHIVHERCSNCGVTLLVVGENVSGCAPAKPSKHGPRNEEMRKMRRLGHSVNKIAEHFKCSRPLVYKILASAGME
jgi:hypothetical protein